MSEKVKVTLVSGQYAIAPYQGGWIAVGVISGRWVIPMGKVYSSRDEAVREAMHYAQAERAQVANLDTI